MYRRAPLLSLDYSTLPLIRTLYCWVLSKRYQVPFLKSLVWRDLGLNPDLPDHWWTLHPHFLWGFFYIRVSWWSFTKFWVTTSLIKSPRTLLSILADLNYVVVWMVSTRPLISKSSSSFNNPLVTIPRAPITIWCKRHFHVPQFVCFYFLSKVKIFFLPRYFLLILLSVQLGQKSTQCCKFFFFLFFYKVWSSGRDYVIRLYVKFHRSLCVTFSGTDAGLGIYHLFVWSNLTFLHKS